jgi:NDP-sugar pyrophosphorylase family protein
MDAVILAAGYGTRLSRDLEMDQTGNWRHLLGLPKPLLPIGSTPLISHWLDTIHV